VFTYFMFNSLIFFFASILGSITINMGFAFGLFAVFAILRYRTDPIPIKEMTYLFIVITIGVINALSGDEVSFGALLFTNTALVGLTYFLEKYWQNNLLASMNIDYEKIENVKPQNHEALLADLKERTGLNIQDFQFSRMNFLRYPDDADLLQRISFIEENDHKQIRMPYLSIVGSHTINGVAELHTELLKTTVFKDFYKLFPERFQNKTNGITPRLWLRNTNPELSELISEKIGDGWITDLQKLRKLEPFADDPEFQEAWRSVKRIKKEQLANWLKQTSGVIIDPESLFDVQIKRIHEYKRQLLNILHVIYLYNKILEHPELPFAPRTILLAGKAAPGYYMAKLIINLANDVARVINSDPAVLGRLNLVFVPNYNVSVAEKIIPATDISQHISTAGTEASGTGNMKFILNGALIQGTMDGANIEIAEEVGRENIFTFGLNSDEVSILAESGYNPSVSYKNNPVLREALSMINTGYFNRDKPHLYNDLYNSLVFEDKYLLLEDFASYDECRQKVMNTWKDQNTWTRMSILNTAGSGKFSSDRTIAEYAKDIWGLEAVTVELQGKKVR